MSYAQCYVSVIVSECPDFFYEWYEIGDKR